MKVSEHYDSRVLVSVIVPCFNRASTIAHAISSVLCQSHAELEVIVADDGSRDTTAQIVYDLSRQDARVRYINLKENRGAQAARNAGIRAARGDWIAFLDSDDEYLPNSVENRLRLACETGSKVIHSECMVLREDNVPRPFGVPAVHGNVYREVLMQPGPMFQGLLARKLTLERIHYLDESITAYQEWDTAIRLARHYKFAFLSEATFIYDRRGGNTISTDMRRDVNGYSQVVSKHALRIAWTCDLPALATHYKAIANRYAALGDVGSQRRYLRRASTVDLPIRRGLGRFRRMIFG